MSNILLQRLTWRSTTLIGFESLLIACAISVGVYLHLAGSTPAAGLIPRMLLVIVVCQLCLYYRNLYEFRVLANRSELLIRVLQALGAASVILALLYLLAPTLIIARGVFVTSGLFVAAGVMSWRLGFEWISRRVAPRERLLLVGVGSASIALARELGERTERAIEVVGFVCPEADRAGAPEANIIGTIEDIPAIVRARGVDRVVVSLADARGKLPMDKLLEMKLDGVTFDHLASVYEQYTGRIAVENLRPSWLIFSEGFRKSRRLRAAKRALDVLGAGLALMLLLPIMCVIAVLVKATSPGPIIYGQRRVGLRGHVFKVRKFRSMREDAEAHTGAVWAGENDQRVTPIGRIMRRTHLDELPQFWNILIGDMSLVGPRPERPEFVKELTRVIPFYGQRHVVRPGLTGWAQVCYAYGASVDDAMQKLQYDLFYIKHLSLGLDIYTLLRTVKRVIQGRGV
jgi:sugar transferase (PEP-CTERM system associated)